MSGAVLPAVSIAATVSVAAALAERDHVLLVVLVITVGAASSWSVMYAASGLAGRAVFPKPWEGAAAGIALYC